MLKIIALAFMFAMTPADKEKYEKLGLAESEWALVLENKIPESKVHELLACGISIKEYVARPWKECRISEAEYIRLRRAGNSDEVVRYMHRQKDTPVEWTVFQSFFLPGLNQLRRNEPVRGWIMAGAAAGCIALFAGQTIHARRFQPLGLFLLLPDMFWSGIDMEVQVQRERVKVLGQAPCINTGIGISISFLFP